MSLDKPPVKTSSKLAKIVRYGLATAILGLGAAHLERITRPAAPLHYFDHLNVTAPADYDFDNPTEANRLLLDFPDELPGMRSVDKYLTPDAQYCLVHIRQAHKTDNMSVELENEVVEVQDNIYHALVYLTNNHGVTAVYREGLTREKEITTNMSRLQSDDELVLHAPRLRYEIQSLQDQIETVKENETLDAAQRDQQVSDLESRLAQAELNLPKVNALDEAYIANYQQIREDRIQDHRLDAGLRMLDTHGMYLYAAEDAQANARSNANTENGLIVDTSAEATQYMLDDRENILLLYASQRDNPLVVTIYGGAHAWGGRHSCGPTYSLTDRSSMQDNIALWNEENPNQKFSLIELTPEGYVLE